MKDNFICKQCGKERSDYPRQVGKDGSICWECSSLNYFNDETIKVINKLTNVAKYHVITTPLQYEYITSIIDKIAEIFKEDEDSINQITSFEFQQIDNLLQLILDKKNYN